MKILIILLTALAVNCFEAMSQDTTFMYDAPLYIPGEKSEVKLLQLKLRKVSVQDFMMAKDAVYIPESDVQGANVTKSKTKAIVYQIPLSQVVSEDHKTKIEQSINNILNDILYDTVRTIVTEIIDDSDPRNVITGAMSKATNNVTANGFYQMTLTYRNNLTLPAKVTFKFTGDGFVWMGERRSTHGSVNVIVDGVSYLVLCNEPPPKIQANDQPLFTKGLQNKEHTIELIPVGNSQFVHDRFVTYKTNITVVPK